MRFTAWTLTALLCAAGVASASDDMTVVSKNVHNGKPSANTTTYFSADHARMGERGGHETIIDTKAGTMTTLDGKKKTYYTTTKQDMEAFNAKMQERMNSPEAKKGMQAMQGMTTDMASSVEVKKTGETRKVAGFTCEEWTITMNAMSTMKECVSSEVKYPAHAFEAFRAFGASMSGSSPFGAVAKSGEGLGDKMKSIKGYPVATSMTTEVMGTKTTSESEVIEISRASIPASTWDVPASYTKIENPMLRAFEHHG
jgi:hypothetical protein